MTNTAERTRIANSDERCEQAVADLRRLYREHRYVEVDFRVGERQRSGQQRKAIEVYCRELARALNDAGMDQRAVMAHMREGFEIPWSQERVKDVLWREVQRAMLGKESTTQLSREEVAKVYEPLNRWTSSTLGVGVPFPEREVA
jgi:hypothetical protein